MLLDVIAVLVSLVSLFFIVFYGQKQLAIAKRADRLSASNLEVSGDELKVLKIIAAGAVSEMANMREHWRDRFPFFESSLQSARRRGLVCFDTGPLTLTTFGHEVLLAQGYRVDDFKP